MYSLATIGIGVVISFMLSANGVLQDSVGPFNAMLVVHVCGLVTVLLVMLIGRQRFEFRRDAPWYLFCAGLFGIALLFINNRTFLSLGVTLTISLGILGQLLASGVIDHFGLLGLRRRPFRIRKLGGYDFIIAGIVVMSLPRG